MAFIPEVATAAATASIPFRQLPRGTEYIYPSVARIGKGPVVNWQWRTDLIPRLQRVQPDTAAFYTSSEEGEMLIKWGFEPKVLGYLPNVRGAVTGVPETPSPRHLRIRISNAQASVLLPPARR
jgi:hypothetical protein